LAYKFQYAFYNTPTNPLQTILLLFKM